MTKPKVVLAYSGGLDTSVAIPWLQDHYGMDVIAFTVDLGQGKEVEEVREKALRGGAIEAVTFDARELFIDYFVWPSLKASALYEDKYPLATALARPLIAKLMVDAAREYEASAVAHGCTGKGNDQVRFDVSFQTLAPDLRIIAPVREWKWTRTEEMAYAKKHNIPVPVTTENPFSIDQNIWGRSCEAGVLEDPWVAPPSEAYNWTSNPTDAPDEPALIEVEFEQGKPIALNEQREDGLAIISQLNELGGTHGIGRIDHVENRLVGIKSRELYEAPAAVILHAAHREIEYLTLSKEALRFKTQVSQEIADIIYNGLWFTGLHQDLMAFVASNQRYVSGKVRMRLYKGVCSIEGRSSDHSLYSQALATYETGDQFDHAAAIGFIKLHGLGQSTQAQRQLLKAQPTVPATSLLPPVSE